MDKRRAGFQPKAPKTVPLTKAKLKQIGHPDEALQRLTEDVTGTAEPPWADLEDEQLAEREQDEKQHDRYVNRMRQKKTG